MVYFIGGRFDDTPILSAPTGRQRIRWIKLLFQSASFEPLKRMFDYNPSIVSFLFEDNKKFKSELNSNFEAPYVIFQSLFNIHFSVSCRIISQ